MKIPKIDVGIISSVLVDIDGPQADSLWAHSLIIRIQITNPVLGEYIRMANEKYGEHAALTGLLVYRFIESQMQADELKELFQ